MTCRGRQRRAAQHHLIDHEFAIVLAQGTGGGLVAGVAEVLPRVPLILRRVRETLGAIRALRPGAGDGRGRMLLVGLGGALGALTWLMGLTYPLVTLFGTGLSWRDIILIGAM